MGDWVDLGCVNSSSRLHQNRTPCRETYNNLRHFKIDGDLGDCPHAHSRVQKKAVAVDSAEDANNGNSMADRAVVLDLAKRRNVTRAQRRILVNDSGQPILDLPFGEVGEA